MRFHFTVKKGELAFALGSMLAEWTGLEPATPGVTGRYSNQLNYHSRIYWWVLRGSNSRHSPCKVDALPTELSTRVGAVGSCVLIQNAELRARGSPAHLPTRLLPIQVSEPARGKAD